MLTRVYIVLLTGCGSQVVSGGPTQSVPPAQAAGLSICQLGCAVLVECAPRWAEQVQDRMCSWQDPFAAERRCQQDCDDGGDRECVECLASLQTDACTREGRSACISSCQALAGTAAAGGLVCEDAAAPESPESPSTPEPPLEEPDEPPATPSPTPVGTCTMAAATVTVCTEYWGAGYAGTGLEVACPRYGGVFAADVCPLAGRIGACRTDADTPFELAVHYYGTGASSLDLAGLCDAQAGEWLE
jgi:hypothetical protein